MFRIISEPRGLIANFVAQASGARFEVEGSYAAIALLRDDEIRAGVLYNGFAWPNILMHIGAVPGRHWLTREFLFAMFDYPFRQLRCRRVTGTIPRKNKDCRKFAENLGFEFEGKMRNAAEDDDLMVYGLLEEKCRFHRENFKQRATQ